MFICTFLLLLPVFFGVRRSESRWHANRPTQNQRKNRARQVGAGRCDWIQSEQSNRHECRAVIEPKSEGHHERGKSVGPCAQAGRECATQARQQHPAASQIDWDMLCHPHLIIPSESHDCIFPYWLWRFRISTTRCKANESFPLYFDIKFIYLKPKMLISHKEK